MRTNTNFNQNWQFVLSDEDFAYISHSDDSNWKSINLPHDWSTGYELKEDAFTGGGGGFAQAGNGWYRKNFSLDPSILTADNQVSLLFEGIYMDATVYLNGIEVGHHYYGYTPFIVKMDNSLLKEHNFLLVRVDNSHQPNSRWYSGSGIYRNVHMIMTDNIHIAPWGVRCCTNALYPDLDQATLLIQTTVMNDTMLHQSVGIQYQVFDHNNELVISAGTSLKIDPNSTGECAVRPAIKHPRLWTLEDPYLYKLVTSITLNDKVIDEISTPIGIRTATFDCDKGFLLNGESVKIKGMCLHHDCGLTGAVGYREVWERRLRKLKDMGCNGIRCSHNPPDQILLDLCDEMGFLVMDEIFDEWMLTKHKNNNYYSQQFAYGSSEFFASHGKEDLITMLRRDFNHPSVILWSIGNEIPEQSSIDGVDLVKYLQDICHSEDVSRMVTSACDNIAAGGTSRTLREFENELDVVGYNYTGRWRERAETFYDEDRHLFPKRRICGSENPAVGGDRGIYDVDSFWGSYATATMHHEALWRYTVSRDFVAGDFLWTGIDYLGECRWPRKGAACGPIDTAGFEKDAYYYFRSIWNKDEITLHLLPHWNWAGQEGEFKQVVCYTNCEEVALYCNGKLVGKRGYACPRFGAVNNWYERSNKHATTNDLHLSWDVPYEPGELKAIGYQNGEIVTTTSIYTTEAPTALTASMEPNEVTTEGIIQIELSAIDRNQLFVPFADNELLCKIEGPAHLIGMDNGNLLDLTPWYRLSRKLFSGKLLAMLQADAPGNVTLTFTSEGLNEVVLNFTIQ